MNKKIPLYVVVLIVLAAVMLTFQITYVLTYRNYSERITEAVSEGETTEENEKFVQRLTKKLTELDKCVRENYYGDLDDDELITWALTGYVAGTGDRFSEYLDAESYKEFQQDTAGEGVGIGVIVIYDDAVGLVEIVNVVPDSSASELGVSVGDYIYTVEGESCVGMDYEEVLAKMRGDEGTTVNFTLIRDGEELPFSAERKKFTSDSVVYHMYEDGKTGIIRITQFDETTFDQFKNAVETLFGEGASQFVFDVRNNPGGQLESITKVLDYLLPEGPIIRIVSKTGEEETLSSVKGEIQAPMVVIANESTASAGELFTAALRDYGKAKIVGKKTFGKGSVQSIIPFLDGSALRLTTAHYLPPYSEGYNEIGIEPDYEIDLPDEQAKISAYIRSDNEDDQLQKALEVLNEQ